MGLFEKDKLENSDCSKLNKAFCKTQDNIMIKSEVVECGYCCLVHEQFALNYVRVKSNEVGTDTIYIAGRFESCAEPVLVYPRGTILARNFSAVPVSFSVYGDQSKTDLTVQPNSEVAVTLHDISKVDVDHPEDTVRLLFVFDIFYSATPIILN